MNDKPYNDVKSYLIGLQQSIKLVSEIKTQPNGTCKIVDSNTNKLSMMFEELQRGNAELSDEISSYLKGIRDGLIWFNEHKDLDRHDYLMKCSVVLNQILGSCFD